MKTARRRAAWSIVAATAIVAGLLVPPNATAEPDTLFGYDVSWPQCPPAQGGGQPMPPVDTDFMIIGLSRGLAFTENPCLASQVAFAQTHGIPAHGYAMATFPTVAQIAAHGPAGPFDGTTRAGQLSNTGYAEGRYALQTLARIGWSPRTIWVDVEPRTAQPWRTGSPSALAENRAVIEGLLHALHDANRSYGIYSYANGWQEITGGWSLPGVPVWATAGRLDYPNEARDRCAQASFSGGEVYISQWYDDTRDYNLTCGNYQFTPPPLRVFGADRYATSAAVSRQAFPNGSTAVFMTTSADFADALAGGAVGAKAGAPVLLTAHNSVPAAAMAELERLRPQTVYLLGGPSAISTSVQAQLAARWRVERIDGADRYATAAVAAGRFWSTASTVFVASGTGFPDALTGGAAAARNNAPVLLSQRDRLPQASVTRLGALNPNRVVVVGGPSAITDSVIGQIRSVARNATVERVAGPDRYGTAEQMVRRFWPGGAGQAFVATGTSYPDALSAVPLAALNRAPIVLSRSTCAPAATRAALGQTGASLRTLIGGRTALATFVLDTPCG